MIRAALLALVFATSCATPARTPPAASQEDPPGIAPTVEADEAPPEGEPAEVTAVCAQVPCRYVATVAQRMPFAFETDVIVAQGDAFSVGGTARDGLLVELRPNPSGPSVAISWSGDRVTVANALPRRLRYRAMVLPSPDTEFEDLEACAIAPGQVSSIQVPAASALFALSSLEYVSADTFDACERR